MLNDSQHIGHSSPSSLLELEQTSSSEHSALVSLNCLEHLFVLRLVRALDAKLHIMIDEQIYDATAVIIEATVRNRSTFSWTWASAFSLSLLLGSPVKFHLNQTLKNKNSKSLHGFFNTISSISRIECRRKSYHNFQLLSAINVIPKFLTALITQPIYLVWSDIQNK